MANKQLKKKFDLIDHENANKNEIFFSDEILKNILYSNSHI